MSIIQYFDGRVLGMVDSVFDNVDELWLCHSLQSQIMTCRDEDISCLGNDQVNWSNLGMGETLLSASACVGKVGEDQKWLRGGRGFSFQFLDKLSAKRCLFMYHHNSKEENKHKISEYLTDLYTSQ